MTRIVAGHVGGRTLHVPPRGTRPTSERVREAVFSRLEHLGAVEDARVLDLFAGSGALGLEAASRGARHVTLVDSARVAADVARRNVAALGLLEVQVVQQSAESFVAGTGTGTGSAPGYHLVLVDPPYDLEPASLDRLLGMLARPGFLDPAAVVVVERSTRTPEPVWPGGWETLAHKDYGETAVFFVGPVVDGPDGAPEADAEDAPVSGGPGRDT
ncbi:16S rRNA (guanine(966)-N(2))-methyltransferase RsmD [Cellulosimicrobium arenosum]|uniref:16S rRNA (Guanine(966)-N(2))-methyltransferase RsmD n=1 Tax=Cellulosimicrobium arenosum TaxID=2708133 RepID=A0A927J2H3_9MICO|nr:16S rRNA (guanine(966)-N(2))-methyltransferase RsmD [Cellulosimicrobium arenosum]